MQNEEAVKVWRGKTKPQRRRDPLAVIRPLLIILRDRPVSADFYEGMATLLDSFTRDHEVFVAVPEREATKDNISTVVHSARHAAEREGWLKAQGETAADEELVIVVAHGVKDQSLVAAVMALPDTGACCATVFLTPRAFPRATFSIGRPSAPSLCISTEASHYRLCLQLMESCAHLAACNGVDATLDLRPCVVIPGAHHWQLMPPQTYNNREVKRPKRGVDTVKVQRDVATALLAFVDMQAKRLLPKVRARQVLLSRMQLSAVLMSPGLWATGLAGVDLILEQTGGEVILHRAAQPLHLPSDYAAIIQLAQPGRLANLAAIPSLVGHGPRHGVARDEALADAIRRGAATVSTRRTQFVATVCRNLQQAILQGFLSGDTQLERQLDLHPGSLLKLRTSAHDRFKVNVTVFESAAGFLRDVPDARLTTTGEVEIQVRCYLHQPDGRWHVPDDVDPDDPDAVAAAAQHRHELRTAHGDALPPEELWVKVCRFDALASLAKRFILPSLTEISPIPLHELRFEDSHGSDWSWTERGSSSGDSDGSVDDERGSSKEGSLYEEVSEDALGEDALAIVQANSAVTGDWERRARAGVVESHNITGADDIDATTIASTVRDASPLQQEQEKDNGETVQRGDVSVEAEVANMPRRKLLRKLAPGAKPLDERHRILRRRRKLPVVPLDTEEYEEEEEEEEDGDEEPQVVPEVEGGDDVEALTSDISSESVRPRSGLVRTYIGVFDSSSVGLGSAPGAALLRPSPPPPTQRHRPSEPGFRTNITTSSPEWRNPVAGPCRPAQQRVVDRLWREGVRGGEEGSIAEVEFIEDCVTRLDVTRSWLRHNSNFQPAGAALGKTIESSPRSVLLEEELSSAAAVGSVEGVGWTSSEAAKEASVALPRARAPASKSVEIEWSTAFESQALSAVPEEQAHTRSNVVDTRTASPRSRSLLSRIEAREPPPSTARRPRLFYNQQLSEGDRPSAAGVGAKIARNSPRGTSKDEVVSPSVPRLLSVPPLWKAGAMPTKLQPSAQLNSPRSTYSRLKTLSEPARMGRLADGSCGVGRDRLATARDGGVGHDSLVGARLLLSSYGSGEAGGSRKWSSVNLRRSSGSSSISRSRAWHVSHRRSPTILSAAADAEEEAEEVRLSYRSANSGRRDDGQPPALPPPSDAARTYSQRRRTSLAGEATSSRAANFQVVTRLRCSLDSCSAHSRPAESTRHSLVPHPPTGNANGRRGGDSMVSRGAPLASALSRRARSVSAGSAATARTMGTAVSRKSVNFGGGVDNDVDDNKSLLGAASRDKEATASSSLGQQSNAAAFGLLAGHDALRMELSCATVTGEATNASMGAKARGQKREKQSKHTDTGSVRSPGAAAKSHKYKLSNSTRLLGKNVGEGALQRSTTADDVNSVASASAATTTTSSSGGFGGNADRAGVMMAMRSKGHSIVARTGVEEEDGSGGAMSSTGVMSAEQAEARRRKLLQDDAEQAAKIQSIINLTQLKRGDESIAKEILATYHISRDDLSAQPLWEAQALAETLYSLAIQIVPEPVRQFHTAPSGGSLQQLCFSSTSAAGAKQLISGPLHMGPGSGLRMEVECPGTAEGLLRCPSLASLVQHILVDYNMACLEVEALDKLEVTIH